MRPTVPSLAVAATVALVGCGYSYTQTTQNAAPPKPESCSFDVLTTRPERPYVELGVLEPQGSPGSGAANASDFRSRISDAVCHAGGDAVLTQVNGLGNYVRGTVIKYKEGEAAPVAAAPVPASAPPTAPAPALDKSPASVVSASAEVRSAPFAVAPLVTTLAQGQRLSVGGATNGWRAATLADGRGGYVQDAQIKVDASAP
ncbi:MAG TPA: hypothetical protein VHL80_14545 [Polyangia bacterium]|nr:hypothetical protein [Polyangia bacterium]